MGALSSARLVSAATVAHSTRMANVVTATDVASTTRCFLIIDARAHPGSADADMLMLSSFGTSAGKD
jgi:hypothetical protein